MSAAAAETSSDTSIATQTALMRHSTRVLTLWGTSRRWTVRPRPSRVPPQVESPLKTLTGS